MSKKQEQDSIENAADIIERFGGIRPMAKKMDVAVTTVQGWKKRDTIPAGRRQQVLQAADNYNINLTGLVDGAPPANENVGSGHGYDEMQGGDPEDYQAYDEEQNVAEIGVSALISDAGLVTRDNLADALQLAERRAVRKSLYMNLLMVAVVAAAIFVAFVFFQPWPKQKGADDLARISELENAISDMKKEMGDVQSKQSFFSNIVPEDLNERLDAFQEKAQATGEKISETWEATKQTASDLKQLSDDVFQGEKSLEERLKALGTHLGKEDEAQQATDLLSQFSSMKSSIQGQEQMGQAMQELKDVLGSYGHGEIPQIDALLNSARSRSSALGGTFGGVPTDDLKAAAMLLAMNQMRSSFNRDPAAFNEDLDLLTQLAGEDNQKLVSAIQKLAPQAQSGVLTPSGLSSEFRTLAGEAVVASLKGEDVSLQEKAVGRMNELFQVEKDGALVTGTDTQVKLAKTEKLLENGDVAGALSVVQSLENQSALSKLQPWIEKARATMNGEQAKAVIDQGILSTALGLDYEESGRLIQNKDLGINFYKPGMKKGYNPLTSLGR